MEKRNLALLCCAALVFWLYALAFGRLSTGTAGSPAAADAAAGGARQTTAQAQPGANPAMAEAELAAQTEPGGTQARGSNLPASPGLVLNCKAAILMDAATGTVLYEMNADDRLPIASITKVMTLLLTFEAVHDKKIALTDTVPISPHAFGMGGSQIWLEPGESFTLDELLRAICVSSANDAAVAVSEYVGGSESVFVERMNARAAELGMTETTFCNACGLDEAGHLSSARDVAVMSREILNECPEVLEYTGIWMDYLRDGQTQLINTNKLLKHYNGITGLKTGTTGGAGVCISATATREGLTLVAVVLGAPSSADRFEAATTLLDYGFANYAAAALPDLSAAPRFVTLSGGETADIPLDYSALPQSLLLEKGQKGTVSAEVSVPQKLCAPLSAGQQVGTVTLSAGETLLGEYPVCAKQAAPRLSFGGAVRLILQTIAAA